MTEARDNSNDETLVQWAIPSVNGGTPMQVEARRGEITTIVGANGAGKSVLGYWLDTQSGGLARRLIAHRKLWFPSAGPDLSPAEREKTGKNLVTLNTREDSRFIDHGDRQRATIVLFDLLARVNSENAQMVALYQQGATPEDVERELGTPVLDRLNAILRLSGLEVVLALTDSQTFDAVHARSGASYAINRMSDGEKSAVLLAAETISSPEGRIFIIDEPERHLHRSISAGLVAGVIADRSDCHFVVLTHDLDLASTLSHRPGRTLALSGCRWNGVTPAGWELYDVDPEDDLPEGAKTAILGGRRDLLFVEGDDHSLDKRLYELLFPSLTVFPAGGADQVVKAVTGLRASGRHHWVNAFGVVDGDARSEAECESLRGRGIMPLAVSEVENVYYLEGALRGVAAARVELVGGSAEDLYQRALETALGVLNDGPTLDRLAGGLAVSALRRTIVDSIPTKIEDGEDPIKVEIASPYPNLRAEIQQLVVDGDYAGLLRMLPVRDTALPSRVSATLGFRRVGDYQAAVRRRASKDKDLAEVLRATVGDVISL